MNNAEKELIIEIKNYEKMVSETNSNIRKIQLQKHINKLKKELKIYRFYKNNARGL